MSRKQVEAELCLGVVQQLKQKAKDNAKGGAKILPVLQKLEEQAESVVKRS